MRKSIILIFILALLLPVTVNAEKNYLYDVLKNEAENNGLAKEYTGEHHDSFTKEPSKKIYHWYAENDDEGNQVIEKNNVIFGGFCWQMIRTTDTGGVKLIYNGEAEDNKCLNNRGNHVGYDSETTQNLNSTYYYGTKYNYDKTNNVFSLAGSISTGEIKIGEYTCKSNNSTGSCSTIYLVNNLNSDSSYNVIPLNGNSHYSQLGITQFNQQYNSPAYVGYMYNTKYIYNQKRPSSEEMLSNRTLSTQVWYADSVSWNSSTSKWELNNPYQISGTSDYPNLVGKYTFLSSNQELTNNYVYYIADVNGNNTFTISLLNGNDIDYYNSNYTYGDTFTDNGNGTFTINNPTTINRLDYYRNYSNMTNKYICKNAVNNTCEELWYSVVAVKTSISYIKNQNNYKYGNTFTYNQETNTYSLSNDVVDYIDLSNNSNNINFNNHHYTCWNTTGECSKISYVFTMQGVAQFYIELNEGNSINDALNQMLYKNDVNTNNSTIKTAVDAWYKMYMNDYTYYLEDTIFCNERSINNLNGWEPNGTGNIRDTLEFKNYNSNSDLLCNNENDKFSVSNSKAKLDYPVGLMTNSEMNILNNNSIRNTGKSYWLGSAFEYGNYPIQTYANESFVNTSGKNMGSNCSVGVSCSFGVRPSVSLRSKSRYSSGDGSKDNPYIFDETNNYSINVEIVDETEDLIVEINDLSQVEEGEEVKFKVTPIKGHKVTSIRIIDENNNEVDFTTTDNKNFTFTMPSSDVTIIPSYERVKNGVFVEDNKNTKEFVIEVNDSQAVVYEDTVRFRVDPEEGYEVESIEITDEEQNKINYKKTSNKNEYEFVMPDTDVLIKPSYRLIPSNNGLPNPNTKRQILLIVISIIVCIMTTLFIKKKKRLT